MKTTTFTAESFMRGAASSLEKRALGLSLYVRGRCLPQSCIRLKAWLHRYVGRPKVKVKVKSNTDSDRESEILAIHLRSGLNRRWQRKCVVASAIPETWGG